MTLPRAVYGEHVFSLNRRIHRGRAWRRRGRFFPWDLVEEIGVINERMAERVNDILSSSGRRPKVSIHKTWYY